MSETYVTELVSPLVRQGLFETPESAILEITEDYVLRQVETYQQTIAGLEHKYGMSYPQFTQYLQQRATLLESGNLSPEQTRSLGQAIMVEEEDALEWQIAREMLQSWLGLRREVTR